MWVQNYLNKRVALSTASPQNELQSIFNKWEGKVKALSLSPLFTFAMLPDCDLDPSRQSLDCTRQAISISIGSYKTSLWLF
jgi:hypothetical protein